MSIFKTENAVFFEDVKFERKNIIWDTAFEEEEERLQFLLLFLTV